MHDEVNSLDVVCRRLDLAFRCEATDRIPSFSLSISAGRDGAESCLCLQLNKNARVEPRILDSASEPPAILVAVEVESVVREPVLELWLPYQARHPFLVFRRDGVWTVQEIPGGEQIDTVAGALALLSPGTEHTG